MTYTLMEDGSLRRVDGAFIPADAGNDDYAAYLAWVAEGNEAAPAPSAESVPPRIVTMRQARLALLAAGKLAAVNAAIAALPNPQKQAAQIEWEFAATVDRDSAFMQGLAQVLGMTDAQLDELFTLAASK